jgi:hypothetical protein
MKSSPLAALTAILAALLVLGTVAPAQAHGSLRGGVQAVPGFERGAPASQPPATRAEKPEPAGGPSFPVWLLIGVGGLVGVGVGFLISARGRKP